MSSCVKTARCSAERLSFIEAKQAFDQLGLNKISPNGLREDTFRCVHFLVQVGERNGRSQLISLSRCYSRKLQKYQIHTLEISFGLGVHILKSGPKVHLVLKRGLAKDQGNVSLKQSFGIILLTNWMTLTECDLEIGKHSERMFLRAYDLPKVNPPETKKRNTQVTRVGILVTLSTCEPRERIRPRAKNSKEHFPKPEDGKQRPFGGNHCDSLAGGIWEHLSPKKALRKALPAKALPQRRFNNASIPFPAEHCASSVEPSAEFIHSKLGCVRAAGHVMAPERLSTAIGLDGDSLRLSEHYIMALILCQRPQACAS
ncbi:hypothetical protein PGTUg99_022137 [Puccinia graminis f. sp. tritici]|uniref:Uncharacterized protein n=1 Tax=Puccinia graminis f. sp. tritici TaxID=56615 RepID=A0A5B0M794_PUCGR|nr:hypothetical protein PGTUg99_022137 [Puccinia graminis f. sp. tritici]